MLASEASPMGLPRVGVLYCGTSNTCQNEMKAPTEPIPPSSLCRAGLAASRCCSLCGVPPRGTGEVPCCAGGASPWHKYSLPPDFVEIKFRNARSDRGLNARRRPGRNSPGKPPSDVLSLGGVDLPLKLPATKKMAHKTSMAIMLPVRNRHRHFSRNPPCGFSQMADRETKTNCKLS